MTHNMCEKRRVRVARAFGYLGHLAALGAGHRLEIPQVVGSVAAQCCSQPLAERAERQTDPDRVKGGRASWGCRRCCWRRRRSRRRRVKGLPCRGGRGKVVIRGAQPALRLQRQRRGGTCT